MQDQLNKMLMDELLTEEQLKFYELTIKQFHNPHGTVHRHSMALLLGYQDLKSKVEEMQKTLEWYADEKNWKLGVNISMGSAFPLHEAIKADKGKRARQALKGESI